MQKFLRLLRNSNLLSPEQWSRFQDAVVEVPLQSPEQMVDHLARLGQITRWQGSMLLAGKQAFYLGKYRLEEHLGSGGMGSVFRARHGSLERSVAIKILSPKVVCDRDMVERFRREMQAVAALNDPHIVTAYDAESTQDLHFLVMEYVPGEDLGRLLERAGPLPVPLACECIRQAALGLQHAADRGMVHRDIKPTNLLLTTDRESGAPRIKILDFGLAKFRADLTPATEAADRRAAGDPGLTEFGQLLGTLDYVAPEQARNVVSADVRSDLFSLGCTFFKLLTGEIPFPGATIEEKLQARESPSLPSVRRWRPEIPSAVEQIVARLLATSPRDRFQSPRELVAAVTPFARPLPVAGLLSGDGTPGGSGEQPARLGRDDEDSRLEVFLDHLVTGVEDTPERVTRRVARRVTPRRADSRRLRTGLAGAVMVLVAALSLWWIGRPRLTIDWPTNDPPAGTVDLGGRTMKLPGDRVAADSRLELRGPAGSWEVKLQRPGHEPFQSVVPLGWFERRHLQPDWRETAQRLRQNSVRAIIGQFAAVTADQPLALDGRLGQSVLRGLQETAGTPESLTLARFLQTRRCALDTLPLAAGEPSRQALYSEVAATIPGGVVPAELVRLAGNGQWRFWNRVVAVASSANGALAGCVSNDQTAQVFAVQSRERISAWGLPAPPRSAQFLREDSVLVVALEGDLVECYDSSQGTRLGQFRGCRPPLAFSPDETKLIGVRSEIVGAPAIGVWDTADFELKKTLRVGMTGEIEALAVCTVAPWVAVAVSGAGVSVWNLETAERMGEWVRHRNPIWHPQSQELSLGDLSEDVHLVTPGEEGGIKTLESAGIPLGFLADRRGLVARRQMRVTVWDLDRLEEQSTFLEFPQLAVLSREGGLLAGAEESYGRVGIWNLNTGTIVECQDPEPVTAVAMAGGADFVVAGTQAHAVRVWNTASGELLTAEEGWEGPVHLADDAQRVVCRRGHVLAMTDLETGQVKTRFDVPPDGLTAIALSPTGTRLAALGEWGFFRPSLIICSVSTGEREELEGLGLGRAHAVAWSRDAGELAVAAAGRVVAVWDFSARRVVETIDGLPAEVTAVAMAPAGGELAIACEDRSVWIWERSARRLVPIRGERSRIEKLSYSLDGKLLAGAASDRVLLIDPARRRLLRTLVDRETGVNDASFSLPGDALAVATSSGRIDLWDISRVFHEAPGAPRRLTIGPPGGRVWKVQYSPDGRHLTTFNGNGTVYLLRPGERNSPVGQAIQQ